MREGPRVVALELERAFQGHGRLVELAQPVPRLPHAGQDPRLPLSPRVHGTCQRQRAFVEVDRGARLDTPACLVPGMGERLDRAVGDRAVGGVEVERGRRRLLQVVRGGAKVPGV